MASTVELIAENVFGFVVPCGDGIDVRALLVCGERRSVLIDTLLRPSDLSDAREIVESRGLPVYVVNSHADWDHWWGNAAFPHAPIVAHRRTLDRQRKEGTRSLAAHRRKDPDTFSDVTLRTATIAFEGDLLLDLGDVHLELHPLPGHTSDCIVAYLPERRLLFAGDVAEDPIPLLNEGRIGDWPDRLEEWAGLCTTVVPAHGAISGPELLRRNATYLRGLLREPGRDVPELSGAVPFYKRAHRRHLKHAGIERSGN